LCCFASEALIVLAEKRGWTCSGAACGLRGHRQQRIYQLPDETKIFVGHDYQPGGRELCYQTTVGEQKRANVALKADTSQVDFVTFREKRDATLPAPKLLFQSVQVNIDAGRLPEPVGGIRYLRMPLDAFRPPSPMPRLELETCERATPGGGRGSSLASLLTQMNSVDLLVPAWPRNVATPASLRPG